MQQNLSGFAEILEEWYAVNGRCDLPWRQTADPYSIWISEIILQQTRVAQGMEYYLRFIERFPNVSALAQASEDEVLRQWQGLGYYSRARNLHAAARQVAAQGAFPTDYAGVRALKGVGDYTAAAICSFAYRLPHAVVDGNVYRVLSRVFGIRTPIDTVSGKKEFTALAGELLDRVRPDLYNSAIMDFGAIQCVPKSPDCNSCPFSAICKAAKEGVVDLLPVKSKKTAVTDRYLVYVYIEDDSRILLRRRPSGDIWAGLYEPYLMEFDHQPHDKEISALLLDLTHGQGRFRQIAKGMKHLLTHRRLWIDCYRLTLDNLPDIPGYEKTDKASRGNYACSKVVSRLFEKIDSPALFQAVISAGLSAILLP